MVPNKFENHIKEKLGEREIQPSAKAWGKLADQLNNTSQRSENKGYYRYAIAAGFIGLLFISVRYFNTSNSSTTPNTQVVDTSKEKIEEQDNSEVLKEKFTEVEVAETVNIELIRKDEETASQERFSDSKKQISLIESVDPLPDTIHVGSEVTSEIIDIKILEVVAQVDALENNNINLTDAEVDSLLRQAQREILAQKVFREDHAVDAVALLTGVEDELDRSFRDKIFESLKTGFIKVRTAVADRNN
ncbi:hypothetical protein MNBD_BACTEROID03-1733 [hydrothermal vent metagenome]|uniref:Uncharacterized protein n=1 Tax=hydrothermal vent metagenome TaxID=652676 RepID=A0A3B0T0U3_9ZZZZ